MYDNEKELEITNRVLLELSKNQKENNKSLLKVLIINIICCTLVLMTLVIGFFIYESQFDTTTTTETITQEVSGEDSDINNVEGDQYNDNATHNE